MTKLYTTASYLLTTAFIVCGICFFSPYWLSNFPASGDGESGGREYFTNSTKQDNEGLKFSRGLWAMCAYTCQWFWEENYLLQQNLFTPSKWHLATQVMYFISCSLLLICELSSRLQPCFFEEKRGLHRAVGFTLLLSTILQVSAIAVFGGCSLASYNAKSYTITDLLRNGNVFYGWTYWLTIPGAICSLMAAIFFLITDCWAGRDKI